MIKRCIRPTNYCFYFISKSYSKHRIYYNFPHHIVRNILNLMGEREKVNMITDVTDLITLNFKVNT